MAARGTETQEQTPPRRYIYGGYQGKSDPSERDRIMHFLDMYRCSEGFAAEYLLGWMKASSHEGLKGGLLTIQQREASHARILEARLLALEGVPQATVAAERRERDLPFYSSDKTSDLEKLRGLSILFSNPEEFLSPLTDLIDQIQEDQQSKELLRTILDDERASIRWLVEMYERLRAAPGAAT
jgi:bacterioferritin (cytochrome b1)